LVVYAIETHFFFTEVL